MINQVETHIFNQQKEMKEWADKYDIQLEAWAPFGEGRGGTFDNPVIAKIAEKYGKTPAQVMLRWHIQRGVVVIPKSTHIERMQENFNVFDFTLTDEDMKTIAELDKAESAFSHIRTRRWWSGLYRWLRRERTITTAQKKRRAGKRRCYESIISKRKSA